jgi:hypothetical protein
MDLRVVWYSYNLLGRVARPSRGGVRPIDVANQTRRIGEIWESAKGNELIVSMVVGNLRAADFEELEEEGEWEEKIDQSFKENHPGIVILNT